MSLPYYKRYPRDFFEGTIGMSFEAKGAYGLVLDIIYMRDGELPDDARYVAGLLGCSVRMWNKIKNELVELGKLSCVDGVISNFRADYLCEERRTYRDKQAENRTRPNKNNTVKSPAIDIARDYTEPEPEEPTANAVVSPPPEKPKRKAAPRGASRKCRLPEGWAPSAANYAYASKHNLTREEINHEADQFRSDAIAKGKLFIDWHAAFGTWLGNTAKWKRERSAKATAGTHTAGKSGGGGLVAAGLRRVSEARGYGEPVSEGRGMGANYVIDREAS